MDAINPQTAEVTRVDADASAEKVAGQAGKTGKTDRARIINAAEKLGNSGSRSMAGHPGNKSGVPADSPNSSNQPPAKSPFPTNMKDLAGLGNGNGSGNASPAPAASKAVEASSPVATIPAPAAPAIPVVSTSYSATVDHVIQLLLDTPAEIREYQGYVDALETSFNRRKTDLSIEALTKPLFPGKKPEDGHRAANNDTERDLAIADVTGHDLRLIEYSTDLSTARRNLQYARNQFEGAKLAATLLASMSAKQAA